MRPLHHPSTDELTLHAVLHALSDPVRLQIVRRLAESGPQTCTGACTGDGLPRATMSRHFDVLRTSGLVHTRKDGTRYHNRLRSAEIDQRFPGLLDRILASAEREERAARGRGGASRRGARQA